MRIFSTCSSTQQPYLLFLLAVCFSDNIESNGQRPRRLIRYCVHHQEIKSYVHSVAWSSDVWRKDSPTKSITLPLAFIASSVVASSSFSISCFSCARSARISSNLLFKRPNSLIFSWSSNLTYGMSLSISQGQSSTCPHEHLRRRPLLELMP